MLALHKLQQLQAVAQARRFPRSRESLKSWIQTATELPPGWGVIQK